MDKSMEVDVYQRLGKKINDLTMRTPWNETFHSILKELYTAQEADVVVNMPYTLSSFRRIAKVTGVEELLLKNILDKLGGHVERILIDDLWNDTYYAKISIALNGSTVDVDSRPSDAIALGLRARAPIYMAESVLEQAAMYEEL